MGFRRTYKRRNLYPKGLINGIDKVLRKGYHCLHFFFASLGALGTPIYEFLKIIRQNFACA